MSISHRTQILQIGLVVQNLLGEIQVFRISVWQFGTSTFKQAQFVVQFFYVLGMHQFRKILFFAHEKSIGDSDRVDSLNVGVLLDFRLEVKVEGHQHFFAWIEHLLVETKALNFAEVLAREFWVDRINGSADHRLILLVEGFVEHERGFACMHFELRLFGIEVPVHLWVGFSFEDNVEFPVSIVLPTFGHLRIILLVSVALESHLLAECLVERHHHIAETEYGRQNAQIEHPHVSLSLGSVLFHVRRGWFSVGEAKGGLSEQAGWVGSCPQDINASRDHLVKTGVFKLFVG
jgi:hypothetical protein